MTSADVQSSPPTIHVPPFATAALPAPGGVLGPEPEDFLVTEEALYEPSGRGDHLYILIEKRSMTTPTAVELVAKIAGCRARDIGYAGLKDKHAVTRQWLSLPALHSQRFEHSELGRGGIIELALPVDRDAAGQARCKLQVLQVSRHTNKLRTGHLQGNRFDIRLTDVVEPALDLASSIVAELERRGLPNYFGAQRFGLRGENLGRALGWLTALKTDRRAAQRLSPFKKKLYASVLQSELFNRYLSLRAGAGLDGLLAGEVVRLLPKTALFSVEMPAVEQHRYARREIMPTGPMFGDKMKAAGAGALDLEERVLQSFGVSRADFELLGRVAPGTRRDLLVRLGEPRVRVAEQHGIRLSFGLPAGSYATQVIRELTRRPFIDERVWGKQSRAPELNAT